MRFSIGVCLIVCAASLQAQTPSMPTESIRRLMVERQRIAGAGIVIGIIEPAGRRIIAVGESGSVDRRPLDGDTIFQIGSVTKVFTTLLLADMVVRGEVSLDDAASNYLPAGIRMPERGRPITLRDLATHTSGLPSMPTNFSLHADPDPISGAVTWYERGRQSTAVTGSRVWRSARAPGQ